MKSLAETFGELTDWRKARGQRYDLVPLLVLTCTAMVCGCKGLRAIAAWGRRQEAELLRVMGFPRGVSPSYSTIRRMLLGIDSEQFERVLAGWAKEVVAAHGLSGEYLAVALDGKVLKGSRQGDLPGMKLVSLLAHELGLVLDQAVVPVETNEHKASLPLLERFTLTNRLVTADAAFMQRDVCTLIRQRHGQYLIVLKENQPELLQDVRDWFEPFPPSR